MRQTDDGELIAQIKTLLNATENGSEKVEKFTAVGWDKFMAALPVLKDRATTLIALAEAGDFLIAERPIQPDDKASKALTKEARQHLASLATRLAELESWTVETIEMTTREFIKAEGLKLGKIGPAIRAALTGTTVSPPIFDMLAVLGRDEALGRMQEQAAQTSY